MLHALSLNDQINSIGRAPVIESSQQAVVDYVNLHVFTSTPLCRIDECVSQIKKRIILI